MEIIASYVPAGGCDPRGELAAPPVGATSVELRADLLSGEPDLAALVAESTLPVVLTLRSTAEGGGGPDDPQRRRDFFTRALGLKVAFFDLERRDVDLLDGVIPRERAILSAHLEACSLPEVQKTATELLASGCRFTKLVPQARALGDVLTVLTHASALGRGGRNQVVFASGEAGRATRLLGPLLAAPIAYAAWSGDRAAAPGQYTPAEILDLAGHLSGRPRRLFAVLGKGVGGSLSPRMHAAAYRALSLPNLFVPLEIGEAAELESLLRPLGESALDDAGLATAGYAVTMPWKEAAAARCDLLAPRAGRAGSVNTVLPRPGRTVGDCTDIDGITRMLLENGEPRAAGAPALVLGAGGAARAAVVALQGAGMAVALAARDRAAAERTAGRLGATAVDATESERVRVVVNATPAGRGGEPAPLLDDLRAPDGALVIDMAYAAAPTYLERLATARRWRYVSGREVLLYQGVSQFAAMNVAAPPVRAMAAALGLEEVQA